MSALHPRLGRDALWLLAARVGTQGLMVLFTILVARRLGSSGLGEYAFVASAVFLANVLTSFGTDMLLVREIAARRDLSRLPAAFLLQVALSILVIGLLVIAAPAIPALSPEAVTALRIYAVALLPLAACTVFSATLRGLAQMGTYAVLNLAVSAAQLAGAWLFVPEGGSVISVALLLLATQLFAALLAAVLCTARVPDLWTRRPGVLLAVRPLVRASAPIALLGVLGMLYQRATVYLLATIAGAAATGQFSAALRAVEASKTGHLAAFGALYPALARARADEAAVERWPRAFARSLSSLLALAALAGVVLSVLADPLVRLLYGPGFEPAAAGLRVLAWVLVPYTVATYVSLDLLAARHEGAVARALVGALVVLIGLAAWWIPDAGFVGACWAMLAAEGVHAALLLVQWRNVRIVPVSPEVVQERELPRLP